ncbi:MAG TPA: FAD-binding oxidoreductase [Cellvibrio sp.]|nr:FAD-binding oxidoreductase [Cellvibrio sp.]
MSVVTLGNAKQFVCADDISILDAAKAQGIILEHSCRTGRCGVCKAKVIQGTTRLTQEETGITHEETNEGFVLTCCRTASEDTALDIEDLGALADIKVQTLPCKIDSITYLAEDIIRVILRLPPTGNFNFLPGQYINIIAKNSIRRSYSIACNHQQNGKLELHIRKVPQGIMSQYWFEEAKENDLLRFEGPHGTFCFREKTEKNIIFLATGTGIAPVKSILEFLDSAPSLLNERKVSVYWGGRTLADIYWQPDYSHIAISFNPVLSRSQAFQWDGHQGYVQDAVTADQLNWSDSVVYACGSPDMIRDAKKLLVQQGLKINNFFSDAFVSSQ